ncbi:MAG TPA: DUF5947 family protein [Gemmatimonadaceae bacterium]|jgi:hypothetical protein|nr:DUF5947 family protein [Gemmatimonadaceae bacterium]
MPLERLKRFVERPIQVERCDLCGRELSDDHDHVIEPAARRLTCVCGPCAVLFSASGTRKRVPRRVRALTGFRLTDAQWDELRLPIDLAFFVKSTVHDRPVANYPSPAGATESLLSLEAWDDIMRENPVLDEMEPDTEALLVNRVGHGRGGMQAEYFLVPIDQCYRLVGLIRTRWTGLSGGTEVWSAISGFFDELRRHA